MNMNLVRSEFRRLISRRVTWLLPAGVIGLMAIGIVIAFIQTSTGGFNFTEVLGTNFGDDGLYPGIASFLIVIGYVIGASSIGADIASGMVEQILTWEPRRLRFLFTRKAVGFDVVFLIALVMLGALTIMLLVLAGAKDGLDGLTGEFWSTYVWVTIRGAFVIALFFILGCAITVLVGSTTGAIVGFFIYAFIIESLLQGLLRSVGVYSLFTNSDSVISGSDVFKDLDGFFSRDQAVHHGPWISLIILLVWVGAVSAAASWLFNRRDIS